jgi:hypothetical protein
MARKWGTNKKRIKGCRQLLSRSHESNRGQLKEGSIMPDDQIIATIMAICDLMGNRGPDVNDTIAAYDRAMQDVMQYRRTQGLPEVGGYPGR